MSEAKDATELVERPDFLNNLYIFFIVYVYK